MRSSAARRRPRRRRRADAGGLRRGRAGRCQPPGRCRLERRPLRARLHLGHAPLAGARAPGGGAAARPAGGARRRGGRAHRRRLRQPRAVGRGARRRLGRPAGRWRPHLPGRDAGRRRLSNRPRAGSTTSSRTGTSGCSARAGSGSSTSAPTPGRAGLWTAGWKARVDPYEDYYGMPDIADVARRLDVSVPWLSAAGARKSLELLVCSGTTASPSTTSASPAR